MTAPTPNNAVKNAIWIGFPFSQDFLIDPAIAPAGSIIRVDLHWDGQTPAPPIPVTLYSPEIGQFSLRLAKAQTAQMRVGKAIGDLILREPSGTERPLNLRISIPILKSLTPPAEIT